MRANAKTKVPASERPEIDDRCRRNLAVHQGVDEGRVTAPFANLHGGPRVASQNLPDEAYHALERL